MIMGKVANKLCPYMLYVQYSTRRCTILGQMCELVGWQADLGDQTNQSAHSLKCLITKVKMANCLILLQKYIVK